jgi:hypothetical protein
LTRFQGPALAICAVVLALAAAGCNNDSPTPSPSAVTDPNEIVALSLTNLETAAFHVEGTIAGSVKVSAIGALMGGLPIGLSGSIKLDGSTLNGDVDMPRQALHVKAVFPSLFGLSVDAIVSDGYAYFKGPMPGAKYSKTKLSGSMITASASPDAELAFSAAVEEFKSQLEAGGATATLAGRETIDGRDAQHLIVTVPAELSSQLWAALGLTASGVAVTMDPVDYWVYVDTQQPAKVRLKVSSADLGNLDVTLTLTKYGQSVSIQAPPADQVGG